MWRPLFHDVSNAPLAFCDRTSVNASDLVAADRVLPEYAGEIYYLRYSESHEWYWLSSQSPKEATMFISYDSEADDQSGGNINMRFVFINEC